MKSKFVLSLDRVRTTGGGRRDEVKDQRQFGKKVNAVEQDSDGSRPSPRFPLDSAETVSILKLELDFSLRLRADDQRKLTTPTRRRRTQRDEVDEADNKIDEAEEDTGRETEEVVAAACEENGEREEEHCAG